MGAATPEQLLYHLMQADEFGVKLEVAEGDYTWEFFPTPIHQGILADLQRELFLASSRASAPCECYPLSDTYLRLPDGSLKRPDLMIYCSRPPLTRQALEIIPEAVVEVLSPGGEKKDLLVGPKLYLSNGVKDVIVIDPEGNTADHFRHDGHRKVERGTLIRLECGCELTA